MDEATLQRMVDRLDIQDALTTYATACDAKDFALLRQCFADDARARYGAQSDWLEGADAIVEFLSGAFAPLAWGHHLVSVYGVDIEDDRAVALMYLLSHQTMTQTPDQVLSMSCRYRNTLRRVDSGWRIAELDLEIGSVEQRSLVTG